MIPKTIHYIWFGKNPKPEIVLKCIESWKKYLPDYKIIEWNEENYDVTKNEYLIEAYKAKKWAFVSDYARFDILYQQGGIYFDTDVEMLKELPESYLNNAGFTGMESTNDIAPGLIFGCEPGHSFLKKILENYSNSHFILENSRGPMTVNARITELMKNDGYKKNGKKQVVNGITIYPAEVFCGFDLDVFEPQITENTISIHHYASSWGNKNFKIKRFFQTIIKKLIGVSRYRKLLLTIRKMRSVLKG